MARTYTETVTTPARARTPAGRDRPFVSLLSDFGLRDPSAGIMRAVVAGICPSAIIVDLSHGVDRFAIRDGALLLWSAVPYLPIGAHVAVVDPGVGTARMGIALQTLRGDYLVGPDNGLLMPAAARLGGITRAHLLEDPRYSLPEISSSFHGRDVFAPAAAHLADGVAIEALGRAVDPRRLLGLEWPAPAILPGRLSSQAIYLDSFGNVKLSALADDLVAALPGLRLRRAADRPPGQGTDPARCGGRLGPHLRRGGDRGATPDDRFVRSGQLRRPPGLGREHVRRDPRRGRRGGASATGPRLRSSLRLTSQGPQAIAGAPGAGSSTGIEGGTKSLASASPSAAVATRSRPARLAA